MVDFMNLLGRSGQFEVVFLNSQDGGSLCILAPEELPDSFTVRRSTNSSQDEPPVELFRTMTLKIRKDGSDAVAYDEDAVDCIIKTLFEREKALDGTGRERQDCASQDEGQNPVSIDKYIGDPKISLDLFSITPPVGHIKQNRLQGVEEIGDCGMLADNLVPKPHVKLPGSCDAGSLSSTDNLVHPTASYIRNLQFTESDLAVGFPSPTGTQNQAYSHAISQDESILTIGRFSNPNANPPKDIISYTKPNKVAQHYAQLETGSGHEIDLETLSPLSLPPLKSEKLEIVGDFLTENMAGLISSRYAPNIYSDHIEATVSVVPQPALLLSPELPPSAVAEPILSALTVPSGLKPEKRPTVERVPQPKTQTSTGNTVLGDFIGTPASVPISEPDSITELATPSATLQSAGRQLRPPVGVKKWCSFFFQYGKCAYMQTGCRFSHEQPPPGVDIFSEYYGREHEIPKQCVAEGPKGSPSGGLTAREVRLALDAREQRDAGAKKTVKGLPSSKHSSGTETRGSKSSKSSKKSRDWRKKSGRKPLGGEADDSETSVASKEKRKQGRRSSREKVENKNKGTKGVASSACERLLVDLDEETPSQLEKFESLLK